MRSSTRDQKQEFLLTPVPYLGPCSSMARVAYDFCLRHRVTWYVAHTLNLEAVHTEMMQLPPEQAAVLTLYLLSMVLAIRADYTPLTWATDIWLREREYSMVHREACFSEYKAQPRKNYLPPS